MTPKPKTPTASGISRLLAAAGFKRCSRCDNPVTGTPVSDPCDPLSRTWCSGECADADSEAAYAQRYGAGVAT